MYIAHLVVIVLRPFFVVDGLKREYPIVYAHLRYDEIRSLPNESNRIKNGRLRPRLIDLGNNAPQFQLNHEQQSARGNMVSDMNRRAPTSEVVIIHGVTCKVSVLIFEYVSVK